MRTQTGMAHQGAQLTEHISGLDAELRQGRQAHMGYATEAEHKEARLSQEIARLCAVVDHLKVDMMRQAKENEEMHAAVVKTMTSHLAEKQRIIEERDMGIRQLQVLAPCLHPPFSTLTVSWREHVLCSRQSLRARAPS